MSPPNPLLGGRKVQRFVEKLRGADAFQYSCLILNASDVERQPHWRNRRSVGEREIEVATITYSRVSGLEGLGSPIISGVGSG